MSKFAGGVEPRHVQSANVKEMLSLVCTQGQDTEQQNKATDETPVTHKHQRALCL